MGRPVSTGLTSSLSPFARVWRPCEPCRENQIGFHPGYRCLLDGRWFLEPETAIVKTTEARGRDRMSLSSPKVRRRQHRPWRALAFPDFSGSEHRASFEFCRL